MQQPIDELIEQYARSGSASFRGMYRRALALIRSHADLIELSESLPRAWAVSDTLQASLLKGLQLTELQGRAEIEQIVSPEFEEVWTLPFREAIERFRQRLNIPIEEWEAISAEWREYAFWISGITNGQLLADIRSLIDRSLTEGTGYREFEQEFVSKAEAAGWEPKDGVSRRARVVFDANMRTAHATGRWMQATKPHVLARFPEWEWRHRDSVVPRPHHLAMDGRRFTAPLPLGLPSGFGCRCTWIPRRGDGSATVNYELSDRLNPKTGETERVVHVPMVATGTGKNATFRYDPNGKPTPMADPGWMPPTNRARSEVIQGMLAGLPADIRDRVEAANLGGAGA
jgi:hypothetical protein